MNVLCFHLLVLDMWIHAVTQPFARFAADSRRTDIILVNQQAIGLSAKLEV